MDGLGNKLYSCKIPDLYLKKKKITFRTLATLADVKKIANIIVFITLKTTLQLYIT